VFSLFPFIISSLCVLLILCPRCFLYLVIENLCRLDNLGAFLLSLVKEKSEIFPIFFSQYIQPYEGENGVFDVPFSFNYTLVHFFLYFYNLVIPLFFFKKKRSLQQFNLFNFLQTFNHLQIVFFVEFYSRVLQKRQEKYTFH